ncbi:MAG: histidine kinase [Treponema sp.]|uniref:sensor histidine kinase n=1 Tax=Treponema sp. TaxID=166 RepID=UPI003FA2B609
MRLSGKSGNKRFYKKLLTIFLTISVIPSLFIGIFSGTLVDTVIRRRLINESAKATDIAMDSIDSLIGAYAAALDIFCANKMLADFFTKNDAELLPQLYEKMYKTLAALGGSGDIHLIDFDSAYITSLKGTPSVYNLKTESNWGPFRAANESNAAAVYPTLFVNSDGTKMASSVISAVRQNGSIAGYAAFDIPLERLKDQLINTYDRQPMNFTLMTDNYYFLFNDADLNSRSQFISWPHRALTNRKGYFIESADGKELLYTFRPSSAYKLIIIGGLNINLIIGNISAGLYILAASVLIAVFICICISLIVSKRINTPLQEIVDAMRIVESGDFNKRAKVFDNDEFGYVAKQFNTMCRELSELFKKDHEKQELLRRSEIKNLQAQIHPHFFYNTLDSIKWLAKLNGQDEIYVMTANLSLLLRNGIRMSNEFSTVRENLENLNAYTAIQKIRFADKFSIRIDVEQALFDYTIPALILQPLVENAMVHGLEQKPGKGLLSLRGFRKENSVVFEVEDDGIGISKTELKKLHASLASEGTEEHIGLINVHKRIRLYYGQSYGIKIASTEGKGTLVTLTLPYAPERL